MNNPVLPLALIASIMIASAPAAAEQAPQTGVRASVRIQATVSARITNGEVLRFGAGAWRDAANQPTSGQHGILDRTHGEIIVDGQPNIILTEFH